MSNENERADFEQWVLSEKCPQDHMFNRHANNHPAEWARGNYIFGDIQSKWEGWQARSRSGAVPAVTEVPTDAEGFADTGDKEADKIINRLNSSDPTFEDCALAVAWIWRKVQDVPQDYPSWQAAAFAERMKRKELEKQLYTAPVSAPADARDADSDAELIETLRIDNNELRDLARRHERNARRYKWLRDDAGDTPDGPYIAGKRGAPFADAGWITGEDADAAIDRAMGAQDGAK